MAVERGAPHLSTLPFSMSAISSRMAMRVLQKRSSSACRAPNTAQPKPQSASSKPGRSLLQIHLLTTFVTHS